MGLVLKKLMQKTCLDLFYCVQYSTVQSSSADLS